MGWPCLLGLGLVYRKAWPRVLVRVCLMACLSEFLMALWLVMVTASRWVLTTGYLLGLRMDLLLGFHLACWLGLDLAWVMGLQCLMELVMVYR